MITQFFFYHMIYICEEQLLQLSGVEHLNFISHSPHPTIIGRPPGRKSHFFQIQNVQVRKKCESERICKLGKKKVGRKTVLEKHERVVKQVLARRKSYGK